MSETRIPVEVARDAGYGAAHRGLLKDSRVVVLGDPTRKYIAQWMLNGDTDAVLAFAAGMWGRLREQRTHHSSIEIAEVMTGIAVQEDSSIMYFDSHFPHLTGVPRPEVERMARRMFDMVATADLACV